ncbi:MAG: DNA-processing protein DprA [Solirubrobacteraceae bacterium]
MRLGVALDLRARDLGRLWKALELPDEQLISALGGRKRQELRSWHLSAAGQPPESATSGIERVCRHDAGYPSALRRDALAPHELHVAGGTARLQELLGAPAVAIVGARRPTDYGMEAARCLGHDLAASGVCVIGELGEGICYGAQLGAAEAGGRSVAIAAGGLDSCAPRSCAPLGRRLAATGCVVSELPCGARARMWATAARARSVALLAHLVIVVEAEQDSSELAAARLASARGRTIAAVPGRITSPASRGTNALLKEGVALVGGAGDALDLLYGQSPPDTPPVACSDERPVEQRLQALLRRICEGHDTISKLEGEDEQPDRTLCALAELELRGLVRRGDGGRYVPRAVTFYG